MEKNRWAIAVDTGGTFTDCIALSPLGNKKRIKVLSNGTLKGKVLNVKDNGGVEVQKYWEGHANIFDGYTFQISGSEASISVVSSDLKQKTIQLDSSLEPMHVGQIFELSANEEAPVLACRLATETALNEDFPPIDLRLGSTKGTNALLEEKGAPSALILTEGFKDLLLIGTQQRPDLFALEVKRPKPIYQKVFEIQGRINHLGEETQPLGENDLLKIVSEIKDSGIVSVAVCLMHAYKNPSHERRVGEFLREHGLGYVSLSSTISPSIKVLSRAETTLVNSYLLPVIDIYLEGIKSKLIGSSLQIMSSSGGLSPFDNFFPKDSLLSGPAGGVIGAGQIAKASGVQKVLTLDMGGTSTDVSRYNNGVDYQFECEVGHAKIMSPSVSIETVAAGGGSICSFDGLSIKVGPESAGAYPGPACYGNGGPLTITDVNLLLGRVDPDSFGIPVDLEESRRAYFELFQRDSIDAPLDFELLEGFRQVANEKMAEAIKKISVSKGYDPKEYNLLSFGGAGGQHACAVAETLKVTKIIAPYDAGLLSAYGIANARVEKFAQKQLLGLWSKEKQKLSTVVDELSSNCKEQLLADGYRTEDIDIGYVAIFLRFRGQENSIEVAFDGTKDPMDDFRTKYEQLYGHWVESKEVEIESVKVVAVKTIEESSSSSTETVKHKVDAQKQIDSYFNGQAGKASVHQWESLENGATIEGPAIVTSQNSTLVIDGGWEGYLDTNQTFQLSMASEISKTSAQPESVKLELFTNRFMSIADEMGELLKRTAFSVNIKERLDFSCGILDANAALIVNAPHIPVHLGSLGVCVRKSVAHTAVEEGDVLITNHPKYGGSHLPDITLIAPVHYKGKLIAYVANRAHHAEIGGKRPGSMPPDAKNLEEEGVTFLPQHIVKNGQPQWAAMEKLLTDSAYPSRAPKENMADLRAGIAALQSGKNALIELCDEYSMSTVGLYMQKLQDYVYVKTKEALESLDFKEITASESLDDGHTIVVSGKVSEGKINLNFKGTSAVHPGNFNANSSIVTSAVLYVLRLMIKEKIPLNEGIMKAVELEVPTSFLDPVFEDDPKKCPAVVGGNTEVSQRLVDTLIKAFKLSACSQGTMNNLLFGNKEFGYYETICGGTGAGAGFHGESGVHHHMTNTMITDPEILELRYPVELKEFSLRKGSGGAGKWFGGDGIVRRLKFLVPLELTLLTQHRKVAPYGMNGGNPGKLGKQYITLKEGGKKDLGGTDQCEIMAGEELTIETPGGGGFGEC